MSAKMHRPEWTIGGFFFTSFFLLADEELPIS